MNRFRTVLLIIMTAFLISACDSRRNQILSSLLVSPTPSATPQPPTETPKPTLTVTPTVTPTPYVSVENMELLFYGDFDLAEYSLNRTISNSKDPVEILRAQVDLLELAYLRGNYDKAPDLMEDIQETLKSVSVYTNPLRAKAWYLNAQCAAEREDYLTVIDSLDKYIAYHPETPLLSEAYLQIAYAYRSLEDYVMFRRYAERAETAAEGNLSEYVRLDIAVSWQLEGDHEEAVRQLDDLFGSTGDDNIKAASIYYLGISYRETSLRDQTIARYQEGINNYPASYYSYLMLLWLLENNQAVSDYQRGLINYYVGQYSLANDAFRRYIKNEPDNDGSSWYFIGICQMNLADYEGAVSSFKKLIEEYPQNRYFVSACDELAYVQWMYLERFKQAAETLTNYVSQHPDQAEAPAFLYEAGRILERGNYLTDAAKTWGRMIDEYPLYEDSKNALFLAAIASYRAGDYETSLAYLNRMLLVSGIPEDQAQANFWIAKNYLKKNDSYNAQRYLELAADQTRTGYYSLRAKELTAGGAYLTTSSHWNPDTDLPSERQIADQWMILTFGLEESALADRSVYSEDEAYQKAAEYCTLGRYQQAAVWFNEERELLAENPAASYAFLEEMVERRMYSSAAYTSRQILTLAGLVEDDRTLDVPNYFNHIRFGAWYSGYVTEAIRDYGMSPFILYALMKQESMFNPWVTSAAGARGLMQIMPDTGAELSKNMHWPPNYTEKDLNRVPVAVNFSVIYLYRMYSYFDQSNAAMIAAYNAGAGNTQKWLSLSDGDPDLLFEIIRFQETRNYLENIYRNTKIYEWLYAE